MCMHTCTFRWLINFRLTFQWCHAALYQFVPFSLSSFFTIKLLCTFPNYFHCAMWTHKHTVISVYTVAMLCNDPGVVSYVQGVQAVLMITMMAWLHAMVGEYNKVDSHILLINSHSLSLSLCLSDLLLLSFSLLSLSLSLSLSLPPSLTLRHINNHTTISSHMTYIVPVLYINTHTHTHTRPHCSVYIRTYTACITLRGTPIV